MKTTTTMTTVHDSKTEQEYAYSLPVKKALVCAYYQYALNDWETWNYDYDKWELEEEGDQIFFKPPGQTNRKRFFVLKADLKKAAS